MTEQRNVFSTPTESSGADGQGGGRAEGGEEGEDSRFADGGAAVVESDGHVRHGPQARKDLVKDRRLGVGDGAEGREETGVQHVS